MGFNETIFRKLSLFHNSLKFGSFFALSFYDASIFTAWSKLSRASYFLSINQICAGAPLSKLAGIRLK